MKAPSRQLDRFAELLGLTAGTDNDGSVPFVSECMGISPRAGNALMQRLRKDLGHQAR